MCGIAGIWGAPRGDVVVRMTKRLGHRGPDDSGYRCVPDRGTLGHSRLSIVDPEGGHQPLVDGGTAAVVNGEIYNAPELRRSLGEQRFATGSDSEVVLHLWAEHGPACVERLDGMYAFAVADGDELFLARDPLGIKPLYTARFEDAVIFASELKALPAGATDVHALPPGSSRSTSRGDTTFYAVPDPEPAAGGLEDHARRLRTVLERAVVKRLMADVPVGAFLSGGLDSSAIAALLRPHVGELHTFSVGVPGSPDLAAARRVARHLETIHHEHQLEPGEVTRHLPEIVRSLESFDADLVRSAVPTWFTARLASRHVKVVLTGEGADELFAGYRYYHEMADRPEQLRAELRRSVAALHDVNLQRVDRMTMAHSLEARVPFLDTEVVATGLAVPVEFKLPWRGAPEKLVLRTAVADLLPEEIVWRDKEQFDEGSGSVDLLGGLPVEPGLEADAYRARFPDTELRSLEECFYHRLLRAGYTDPTVVLENVARWADRPAI